MNDSRNTLRRTFMLTVFALIGLVASLGVFTSGCDKKAPTTYQEIDSVPSIFEPEDTVFWDQDSVYVVQIETTENTLQGMHIMVDVFLKRSQHQMGGFDFMIAYDASALNFQAAIPGDLHAGCRWEYFNYRFGPIGGCEPICPSGMFEVVAIAETNNGPNHPDMECTDSLASRSPATLFTLDFLVSNDRTFECAFVPIRFYWTNCTDNSIAYHPSDDPYASIQGVSRYVFDDQSLTTLISDGQTGFPTYAGTQEDCLNQSDPYKPVPVQIIDFINGGVGIICAEPIDARGDINLNGVKNEIVDAVIFSNYFVHGSGVFNVNYNGQVAASDVNANGVPLEVADLVYLIRIIVGDALPNPNLTPVYARLTHYGGVLSINTSVGAAHVVAEGDVNPTLLADRMEMSYAYDGHNTRILISMINQGAYFEGDFLQLDAQIISVECADYNGRPISFDSGFIPPANKITNHPNPFRDSTVIAYSVPFGVSSECSIFNATGLRVAKYTHDGVDVAVTIEWDASDQPEGIYVCRVEVEGRVETHTMMLVRH